MENSCQITLEDNVRILFGKTSKNGDEGTVWTAGVFLLQLDEVTVGDHAYHPLGAGFDQLTPPLMEMQQVRKFKFDECF